MAAVGVLALGTIPLLASESLASPKEVPVPAPPTTLPGSAPADPAMVAALEKRTANQKLDASYQEMMDSIFARDAIADIRVTFGYDDTRETREVNDPIRAERFSRSLTDLGFQDYKVTEQAAKTLGVPVDAPNLRIMIGGTRKGQTLRVAFMWSALSKNGTRNIGVGYPDQLKRSEEAMDFTKKACAESEVMIYVGHSRGGGGPDTYPPETKLAGGGVSSTDFSYYKRNRPGMQALGPHLRKLADTPKLVSWTGCQSDSHFRSWFADCFSKKDHNTGVILSTRLTSYTPWRDEVAGLDEGVMVALAIIQAMQEGDARERMMERLFACEMEQMRNLDRPAWRLSMLPGRTVAPDAPIATPPAGRGASSDSLAVGQ